MDASGKVVTGKQGERETSVGWFCQPTGSWEMFITDHRLVLFNEFGHSVGLPTLHNHQLQICYRLSVIF